MERMISIDVKTRITVVEAQYLKKIIALHNLNKQIIGFYKSINMQKNTTEEMLVLYHDCIYIISNDKNIYESIEELEEILNNSQI